MITLSKKFRFESAHRLAKNYVGKCANIHGHSWNGELKVTCSTLNEQDMGVDYGEIGKFLKAVEEIFDHKILLWEGDVELINALIESGNGNMVTLSRNPTSEALAIEIFNMAVTYFKEVNPYATVVSVTINETCTTECVYTGEIKK